MQIQHLRTFLGLIEAKGLTAAAKRLGMTQPGVSQHLKALENYYDVQLVIRGRKKIELTQAGEHLAAYAKKLFFEMEDFKNHIGIDNPNKGPCRFASPGSFGMKMYSFLLQIQSKNPELLIHYEYRPNQSIELEILEDRLDIGFVTKQTSDPALTSHVIDQEKLCLVLPAKHKDISFEGLKKLGLINHPDGFYYVSRIFQLNFPRQFNSITEIPIKGFINQITRIPEPVSLGMGFTALPEYAASAYKNQKAIKIVTLAKPAIDPIFCIKKHSKKLPSRYDWILKEFNRYKNNIEQIN